MQILSGFARDGRGIHGNRRPPHTHLGRILPFLQKSSSAPRMAESEARLNRGGEGCYRGVCVCAEAETRSRGKKRSNIDVGRRRRRLRWAQKDRCFSALVARYRRRRIRDMWIRSHPLKVGPGLFFRICCVRLNFFSGAFAKFDESFIKGELFSSTAPVLSSA